MSLQDATQNAIDDCLPAAKKSESCAFHSPLLSFFLPSASQRIRLISNIPSLD
ncbi:hypothetical protein M378DRAFT_170719 [Amanita muscaria Koide BX008]|uniref:Uncharacterized protein n=1 Tax=Amanita muscaria (strain Koide BX008) TaxID=946122 RepID=A0A0C2SW69_AMAMK|nr:hypothetical protein M378DRAFT_170719 [Amanita muscaria Koide BX008]